MNQNPYDEVVDFLKRLLDPEDLGWSVSQEVRQEAKRLINIYKQEQNKLELA